MGVNAEHPVQRCSCGHSGDAPQSGHQNVAVSGLTNFGQGPCKAVGCPCTWFTWTCRIDERVLEAPRHTFASVMNSKSSGANDTWTIGVVDYPSAGYTPWVGAPTFETYEEAADAAEQLASAIGVAKQTSTEWIMVSMFPKARVREPGAKGF